MSLSVLFKTSELMCPHPLFRGHNVSSATLPLPPYILLHCHFVEKARLPLVSDGVLNWYSYPTSKLGAQAYGTQAWATTASTPKSVSLQNRRWPVWLQWSRPTVTRQMAAMLAWGPLEAGVSASTTAMMAPARMGLM